MIFKVGPTTTTTVIMYRRVLFASVHIDDNLLGSSVCNSRQPEYSICCLKLKVKVCFLYSAVSSPLDRSKRFTPLADTNLPSLRSILAISNYAQRLLTHISTIVYSQVIIYTAA